MAEAQEPDGKPVEPHLNRRERVYHWLDVRTGMGSLMHEALDEPIPGGARWAYVFGSVLLFLFISQTITGVFLSLYYAPTADHAHTTVAYIVKEVTGGSFSAQPARLRVERGRHRDAASSDADISLRRLQRPPRSSLDFRLRAFWSDAGDGVHRLFAAVGPEGVLRHHCRDEHGERSSADRFHAQTHDARRKRDGHPDIVALFCGACFPAAGVRSSA